MYKYSPAMLCCISLSRSYYAECNFQVASAEAYDKCFIHTVCSDLILSCRWLQFNSSATYDTLAIASMQNAARVENSCHHCIFVYAHDLGTAVGRYAALPGLIESSQWKKQVAGKYDYIYFPQEEIVQTVESVNRYARDTAVCNNTFCTVGFGCKTYGACIAVALGCILRLY